MSAQETTIWTVERHDPRFPMVRYRFTSRQEAIDMAASWMQAGYERVVWYSMDGVINPPPRCTSEQMTGG